MRLLDLFCGAGGAAMGYHRAGFDVVGVDINPQPRYPFDFIQADAMQALSSPTLLTGFDVVHASPPCKSENPLRHLHDVEHPDLLTPTLQRLADVSVPWVIENVGGTEKLPGSTVLCGASFGLQATCRDGIVRPLRRHRRFASNRFLMSTPCACSGREVVGVYGHGGSGTAKPHERRGYQAIHAEGRKAMGIDWMTQDELAQAIPPAYTQFIGEQLVDHLERGAA